MPETGRGSTPEISTDPDRLDRDLVHTWLSTDAYWAMGRSREVFDRAVAGSINFGLYEGFRERLYEGLDGGLDEGGRQVGYARVVSDRATFAWLCDVYLDRAVRGAGLGTWFVGAVCDEVRSWGLRRIVLATADAHGLYAKLGFTPMVEPDRWMELRLSP